MKSNKQHFDDAKTHIIQTKPCTSALACEYFLCTVRQGIYMLL